MNSGGSASLSRSIWPSNKSRCRAATHELPIVTGVTVATSPYPIGPTLKRLRTSSFHQAEKVMPCQKRGAQRG